MTETSEYAPSVIGDPDQRRDRKILIGTTGGGEPALFLMVARNATFREAVQKAIEQFTLPVTAQRERTIGERYNAFIDTLTLKMEAVVTVDRLSETMSFYMADNYRPNPESCPWGNATVFNRCDQRKTLIYPPRFVGQCPADAVFTNWYEVMFQPHLGLDFLKPDHQPTNP